MNNNNSNSNIEFKHKTLLEVYRIYLKVSWSLQLPYVW